MRFGPWAKHIIIREKSVILDNGKGNQYVFLNKITRKGPYIKRITVHENILRPPTYNFQID